MQKITYLLLVLITTSLAGYATPQEPPMCGKPRQTDQADLDNSASLTVIDVLDLTRQTQTQIDGNESEQEHHK